MSQFVDLSLLIFSLTLEQRVYDIIIKPQAAISSLVELFSLMLSRSKLVSRLKRQYSSHRNVKPKIPSEANNEKKIQSSHDEKNPASTPFFLITIKFCSRILYAIQYQVKSIMEDPRKLVNERLNRSTAEKARIKWRNSIQNHKNVDKLSRSTKKRRSGDGGNIWRFIFQLIFLLIAFPPLFFGSLVSTQSIFCVF